ncbi:MAG: hypothetical protein HYX41_00910 [Bdellovibrio sp.]|nr:hypothetical protein [Bdellovibrio sp.]
MNTKSTRKVAGSVSRTANTGRDKKKVQTGASVAYMGSQKPPAKGVKKPSKLESIKTLVFGGKKTAASKAKFKTAAPVQKKPAAKPTKKESAVSKASSKMKATAVRTGKENSSAKSAILHGSRGHHGVKSQSVNSLLPYVNSLGETVCREVACEGLATSGGYCRLHYIKNWKKIKRKETILREKKLNQYIEELILKYPDKYIEAIRQDLANDKDFAKVIYDLDLDESVDDFEAENAESVDSLIDTIKRDFDDETEAF